MPEGGIDPAQLTRIETMLEELVELTEENNKILHAARRADRLSFWFKVIVWTVVLVLPFFLIGPIMKYFSALTGGVIPSSSTGLFGVPSAQEVQKAVEQYRTQYQATHSQ